MITLKGRQALLNHQFSVLAYQRDIITILDNLDSIKSEIRTFDKKVDNNLIMTKSNLINKNNNSRSAQHSNLNQEIDEEEKVLKDDSYSHSNSKNES